MNIFSPIDILIDILQEYISLLSHHEVVSFDLPALPIKSGEVGGDGVLILIKLTGLL